ncbi:MAG: hypothetical protein JWO10_673 [Microbacteriaceae bacterium]|nr:hypothetical protein [Microbacteriaceae bacterium]
MMRTRSRIAATVLMGIAVAASIFGVAGQAQAHNYLVSSTPSAGQTLTALPAQFAIVTNDALLDLDKNNSGFALLVQDSAGLYYGDGCVTVDGPTMSADPALGSAGNYTVTWQVVSTDGHTVSDSYSFTWAPVGGGQADPSQGSKKVPDCNGTVTGTSAAPGSGSGAAVVDDGTLATVLWVGGAILAVAVGVIGTLLLTSRRKRA